MSTERFGVSDLDEVYVSRMNGVPHFSIVGFEDEISIEAVDGKRGFYQLPIDSIRRDLESAEVLGLAKRHAPYEATHYLVLREDRRTISGVQYYKLLHEPIS